METEAIFSLVWLLENVEFNSPRGIFPPVLFSRYAMVGEGQRIGGCRQECFWRKLQLEWYLPIVKVHAVHCCIFTVQ